ncbi:DUF4097 family beta strand repeat-containing protein [Paenibacillus sepulcri]|uniref:DUF4097 domain-containing protein n=1 Tax=Paenibacillus sepulcri TaxID=359917 RepID=A0ABS7C8F5_9BACL|nr:DUF4097 domain-containing protein [Paenibacillus sepulcri]
MKKLIGALLLLGGLIMIGASFPGEGLTWRSQEARIAVPVTIEQISINASNADIRIIADDDSQEMEAALHGSGTLSFKQEGISIDVLVEDKAKGLLPTGSTLDIHIPSFYKNSLIAEVSDGDIHVYGQSEDARMVLNKLAITLQSGDVNVSDVNAERLDFKAYTSKFSGERLHAGHASFDIVTGKINLDHYSGDYTAAIVTGKMNASNIAGGVGKVKLTAGKINLDRYSGGLHAEVTDGDVNARLGKPEGSIAINILEGDATLSLPEQADIELDAAAQGGSVNADYPFDKIINQGDRQLHASSGTGKVPIDIHVQAGDVNIGPDS